MKLSRWDRTAPGVRVTLLDHERASSGRPLDLAGRILSFTYEDSATKADKVTIQLDNTDLSLFDRSELLGGALLEVSWGYPGNMAPPRRVVIKSIKGFTTLTLEGHALSVLMATRVKTRKWEQATSTQVVREIAGEHGYQGSFLDVEETGDIQETINQSAETDAQLLGRLARKTHAQFYVDDAGLHFHGRRQYQAPVRVYTWYSNKDDGEILSLSVESKLLHRTGKVTVKGRDPLTKSTITATATSQSTSRVTLGETVDVVDPESGETSVQTRNATEAVHPSAGSTLVQVQQEANGRFVSAERETLRLSMQIIGDPMLRSKAIVEVRGISRLLSGKYYVKKIKHSINSSGYVCDLELTRDGMGHSIRPRQGGERNTSVPRKESVPAPYEVIDPESGQTHIEFRRDDQSLGSGDPEGMRR